MKLQEAKNPNFKEYVKLMISRNKFMQWMGFEITKIEPGYIEGELLCKDIHHQQNGWLHGGVSSAIIDIVEGFASYSLVEEGQKVVTVDARISYYHPGVANKFYAQGYVQKSGKRFHFCEGEIFYLAKEEKIIVAKGSATMAVL